LEIVISPRALNVINEVAGYVESVNTPGSGARFAVKFKKRIEKLAMPNTTYALCSHHVLATYKYSCSYYNDWVIAFRINGDKLTVYDIIHGSLLF
jgi:hypothetical protein